MDNLVYIIQCPPAWLRTPPLGPAYLSAYLKAKNIPVKVLDLNRLLFPLFFETQGHWPPLSDSFEDGLFEKVLETSPSFIENVYKEISPGKIIGFSIYRRNAAFSFKLAEEIKRLFPEKTIVYGGPHTLFIKKQNHLPGAGKWVIGEGELPIYDIALGGSESVYDFCEIENIDTLPFPDFAQDCFKDTSAGIPIFSSRGCPHKCNFCSERLLSKKFRANSAGYIVEMIKYLLKKHGRNKFIFCDSLINYDNGRLREFCEKIIAENIPIKWEAQMRVDSKFDSCLGKLMKESGCYNLFIGMESASDRVLSLMKKGFSASQALDFFKKLNEAKLNFEVSLITGYPGETDNDFRETVDFIVSNKRFIPKIAQVNPFVDYLGDFPYGWDNANIAPGRVKKLLGVFSEHKIRYTKAFINNLVY